MKTVRKVMRAIKNKNFFSLLYTKISGKPLIKSPNARAIENEYRTYKRLFGKYKKVIDEFKSNEKQESSNYVWICWFQGIDNAPDLIKACVNSVKKNMPNRDIVILTNENIGDYIQLPNYIIEKYNKGIIPKAHFSDAIRIELLCKYGGIWIDSTVLCTSSNIPKYILEAPLFVYKSFDLYRTNESPTVASNWFIAAKTNNPILLLTRKLLFDYWKDEDELADYYIFHLFFAMATRKYKTEWEAIPAFNNHTPHTLMFELGKKYSAERWKQIEEMSVFHKLERHTDYSNTKNSMYQYIIKTYIE